MGTDMKNQRQTIFIAENIKTGNATESAIRAGYSSKTAYSIGQRLLKNVEVRKAIENHRNEISKQADITISEVVKEIREMALYAESETNRLRAYDMLMKHLGGYVNEMKIIEGMSEDQLNQLYQKLLKNLEQ